MLGQLASVCAGFGHVCALLPRAWPGGVCVCWVWSCMCVAGMSLARWHLSVLSLVTYVLGQVACAGFGHVSALLCRVVLMMIYGFPYLTQDGFMGLSCSRCGRSLCPVCLPCVNFCHRFTTDAPRSGLVHSRVSVLVLLMSSPCYCVSSLAAPGLTLSDTHYRGSHTV